MNDNNEYINCPYCNLDNSKFWAKENGYTAVKCNECGFIYVNPRPSLQVIKNAIETGYHNELTDNKLQ